MTQRYFAAALERRAAGDPIQPLHTVCFCRPLCFLMSNLLQHSHVRQEIALWLKEIGRDNGSHLLPASGLASAALLESLQ